MCSLPQQKQQTPAPAPSTLSIPSPSPELLGSGAASNAARELQGRKKRLDGILDNI